MASFYLRHTVAVAILKIFISPYNGSNIQQEQPA